MEGKCILCGKRNAETIHNGTRDNENIDVLKCKDCGLVFLDRWDDSIQQGGGYYEEAHMHDNEPEETFEEWIEITKEDDMRRAESLKELCEGKSVLDFGCGSGGFLRFIKPVAMNVSGIELERDARERLNEEGLQVYETLEECSGEFDVITSFHVLEHLAEPKEYLIKMKNHLKDNGSIIIETPNADDALLSLYNIKEFADFTYWSPHIILYNHETIKKLADNSGLKVKWNRQVQRYPLANHLYWLSKREPGGQEIWKQFCRAELEREYQKVLEENNICDTLWVCLGL